MPKYGRRQSARPHSRCGRPHRLASPAARPATPARHLHRRLAHQVQHRVEHVRRVDHRLFHPHAVVALVHRANPRQRPPLAGLAARPDRLHSRMLAAAVRQDHVRPRRLGRGHDCPRLVRPRRQRLLHVQALGPGLDGRQRFLHPPVVVPVPRDRHDVRPLPLQHLAVVRVRPLRPAGRRQFVAPLVHRVRQRHHPHVRIGLPRPVQPMPGPAQVAIRNRHGTQCRHRQLLPGLASRRESTGYRQPPTGSTGTATPPAARTPP